MATSNNNINLVLTATDTQLQATLTRTSASMKRMSATTQASAAKASKSLAAMAATASTAVTRLRYRIMDLRLAIGTLAGVFVIKKVTDLAATFEKSLANINTLLDGSGVSIERYKDQLVELSQRSSKDILDLSKALYQTISAGIPAIEGASGAFATLDAAQKAAVAGLSTTEDAVNALVTVVNAYGAANITAAEASDKLLKTVQLGRTTFPELAHAIGRVAPMASKFNVTADDMLAVLVQLTRSGLNTNESVTALRALIKSLAKPTKQTQDALDELNKTSGEAEVVFSATAMQTNGLIGQLQALTRATGGSVGMLTRLFPNVRAVLPAIIAVGAGINDTKSYADALSKSLGTTDVAVAKVAVTFKEISAILKSQFEAVLIQAGTRTLPLLKTKVEEFGNYIVANQDSIGDFFEGLVTAVNALVTVISTLAGPVVKVFLAMFLGASIRAYNALIMKSSVAMAAWGTTAVASFTKARAAATAAFAAGGGALKASSAFMGSFVGGLNTSMAANAGAMQRIMGKLPSYLGIVAIGMIIGEMLGDAIGKGLVKIFKSGEMEEARAEAAAMQERFMSTLSRQGFTSAEQFREVTKAEFKGEAFRIDDKAQRQMRLETEIVLKQNLEKKILEGVLNGTLKADKVFSSEEFKSIGPLYEAVKTDRANLTKLIRTRNTLTREERKARDEEIKNQRAVVAASEFALQQRIRGTANFQAEVARLDKKGLFSAIGSFKNQAEQYVNVQKFMAQQKKLRIAEGQTQEEAAAAVRTQGLYIYSRQESEFEQKLHRSREEQDRRRAAWTKYYAGLRAKYGEDIKGATKEELEVVKQLQGSYIAIKKQVEQTIPQILKMLRLRKNELTIQDRINRAQVERSELAAKAARLEKERQERERRRRRAAAAAERIARAEEAIRKRFLALSTRQAQLEVKRAKDAVSLKQGEIAGEKSKRKQIKFIKQQIELEKTLTAKKVELAKKEEAEALRSAKQASRRITVQLKKDGAIAGQRGRANRAIANQQKILAKEVGLVEQETNARVAKAKADGIKKVGELQGKINRLNNSLDASDARKKRQAEREAAKRERERQKRYNAARDRFFREDEERERIAAEFAKEKNLTEKEAKNQLFEISKKIKSQNVESKNAILRGALSYERMANFGKKFEKTLSASTVGLAEAASNVVGDVFGLDFEKAGESLKNGLIDAAKSFTDFLKLGTTDLVNVLTGGLSRGFDAMIESATGKVVGGWVESGTAALGKWTAQGSLWVSQQAAKGAAATGNLMGGSFDASGMQSMDWSQAGEKGGKAFGEFANKGFKTGARFLAGTILGVMRVAAGVMGKALDGFVKILATVLDATLTPMVQALQGPLSVMLGGLGESLQILTKRPSEARDEDQNRELRNAEYRELIELEREATLRRLEQEGATNEEVARAQSEFARRLEEQQDEITPDEAISNAFSDALAIVENILNEMPRLIESFMVQLADKLPTLITKLIEALAAGIVAIAKNIGPIITNIINALIDAMPVLIDALVEAIPILLEALLDGLILLIERLPELITMFIEGLVEMLPKLIEVLAEKLPDLVVALVEAAPQIVFAIIRNLPAIIWALVAGVAKIVFAFIKHIPKIVWALIKGIGKGLEPIGKALKAAANYVWDRIKAAANYFWERIKSFGRWLKGLVGLHSGGLIQGSMINKSTASQFRQMGVKGYNVGGMVSGALADNYRASVMDNVPALLQTGEGVLNRRAMMNIGGEAGLASLNRGDNSSGAISVNVGLKPNEGGIVSAAAALLPFLLSGVSADIVDSTGEVRQALDATNDSLLGFRGVPGRSS